jgi:hypothetical protein
MKHCQKNWKKQSILLLEPDWLVFSICHTKIWAGQNIVMLYQNMSMSYKI